MNVKGKYTDLLIYLETNTLVEEFKFLSQELGLLIITPATSSSIEDFNNLAQTLINAGAKNCIPVLHDGVLTMHMLVSDLEADNL